MRIVIDLQGAQTASRFRGIGRYTMALTRAILRNAGSHEVWLVLNGALAESIAPLRAGFEGHLPQDRIRVFDIPGRVGETDPGAAPRCRAAEMLREQFIALLEPDVVLVTSLFEGYLDDAVCSVGTFVDGRRTAVILYDLIPLLNPDTYIGAPPLRQFYMRKIDSLKRAGLLLSISDYAREEAIATLGLAPAQVVAISAAVDEDFAPAELTAAQQASIRVRFGIARPFVMCAPGGYESRKNLAGLVSAWAQLPAPVRAGHQLLVASRLQDHDREQLERHAQSEGLTVDELVLTGYVSDDELIALYQAAALFVLPSLHEGFGLPALEAMACGTPVIGSNTTSIPEVIGLDEAMFDPYLPQSIAARIAGVLLDPALRERLRAHGRVQARKFSWDHTARRALRALEAHAEVTAAPAARPRAALVEALAGIPALAGDEQTLVQLALCMAAMPALAAPRRLLVDFGAAGPAAAGGTAWLHALPHSPAPGMQVLPVVLSSQGGAWHYRYAGGRVADISTGDVVLTLDPVPGAFSAACADGMHAHLRRLGVELHFLLGAQAPHGAAGGGWLAALLAHADRIVCRDDAAAASLQAQRALLAPGARAARVESFATLAADGQGSAAHWLLSAFPAPGPLQDS